MQQQAVAGREWSSHEQYVKRALPPGTHRSTARGQVLDTVGNWTFWRMELSFKVRAAWIAKREQHRMAGQRQTRTRVFTAAWFALEWMALAP